MFLPLLIVDTREVAMNDGMIGAEAESTQVGCYCPVKYPGLLEHIPKVNVGVQE